MARRLARIAASLVALAPFASAAAQETPTPAADLDRIVRDQRLVKDRIEKIVAKMERLAEKLTREEKKYSARLLEEALAELRTDPMPQRIDELVPELSAGRFASIDRQEEVLARLERIYTILLDRNDMEKLEERLALVQESLQEIGRLQGEQQRLIDDTRELGQDEQAILERARDEVVKMLAEQQRLAKETEQSAAAGDEQTVALKQALDALAARQANALSETRAAIQQRTGVDARDLENALSAAQAARERSTPTPEAEAGRAAEKAADLTALQDDLERVRQALDAASAHAGEDDAAEPAGSEPDATRQALAAAKARAEQASSAARRAGDEPGAAPPLESTLDELVAAIEHAREELRQAAGSTPESADAAAAQGQEAREAEQVAIAQEAARVAGELAREEGRAEMGRAATNAQQAAQEAQEAAGEIDGDPVAAASSQQEALDALNAARAELQAAAEQGQERSDSLAARQDYLASQAEALARDMEGLERARSAANGADPAAGAPQPPPPAKDEGGLLRLSRETEQHMEQASRELSAARPGAASPGQQSALSSMQQMQEALEKATAEAGSRASQNADEAERREEYTDLAERQRELEARSRELAERIRELENQASRESLQNAASRMNQAGSQLEQEQGESALPREEEAETYLKQAQREMKEEEQRYQNLRQEELLFQVREELIALREEQAEVLEQTAEVDRERAEGSRLARSARARVRDLATRERTIRQRNDEMTVKIRDDGSQVFTFALERNSEDLAQIADLLGSPPHVTDAATQEMQRDVLARYDELIAVLKDELERRRSAKPEEGGEQPQGEPQQPLIPRVAELLMVKRMEEDALRKVDAFLQARENGREIDDVARARLVRLGLQHTRITELFNALVQQAEAHMHVDEGDQSPDGEGGEDGEER